MDRDRIEAMRRSEAAWRLLRADHAPLVLGFLGQVFIEENVRSLPLRDLEARLDDVLFAANQSETVYPRSAKDYLTDWSAPEAGWLRTTYPPGSDEPWADATPAVERAWAFLESLQARSFVGTESRLTTVFDLLRQIVHGAETDPDARLAELQRRRDLLDEEIERVRAGEIEVLDTVALRDRYAQLAATARELLADFRQVEDNFRALDRGLREQIADWHGSKGDLLDEVLGRRRGIAETDQGRSFQAFYDFLLAPDRQDEFRELLARTHELAAIDTPDPRMSRIHHDWLDAGERTQQTVRQLSEQLRRFLDEQVWLENRRVVELVRAIESAALRLRDDPPDLDTVIDGIGVTVSLPTHRPLYTPAGRDPLADVVVTDADEQLDVSALFEQTYVDRERLVAGVRRALTHHTQVGLSELVRRHPLERGLAEVVTYLSLTDRTFDVVFDDSVRERMAWTDGEVERTASVPRVTYVRTATLEVTP